MARLLIEPRRNFVAPDWNYHTTYFQVTFDPNIPGSSSISEASLIEPAAERREDQYMYKGPPGTLSIRT
jgi:hypothetical protein